MADAIAYVGIGSNLETPVDQVQQAFQELNNVPGTRCVARSPLYRTAPLGPPQPDFINAVAKLVTALVPDELLTALQAVEQGHGRVRRVRWGPRTLDLDLLLYDAVCQQNPRLTIPHPRMHERAFVLYPLHDVAPDLQVPGRGTVAALLQTCPADGVERL